MSHPVKLGVFSVASPLEVGAGDASLLMNQLHHNLKEFIPNRLDVIVAPEPVTDPNKALQIGRYFDDQRVDAVCAIAASWYEDYLVLDLLEECNVPIIAWSRPGMETGSLCGMQQLGFMLKQLGYPFIFIFSDIGEKESLIRTWDFALASSVKHHLRRSRIGFLGHRVEGMTETTPHELALKKIFGPRVVSIDTQIFLDRVKNADRDSAAEGWQRLKQKVGKVISTDNAGIESLQVYITLKEMVSELGLAAMTVGCYPHLMGKVCLPISLLGEEGIPIACEGDVNGALGMLILTNINGQPIHNTDLLDPIPEQNAIVFSHCGNGGFSLASSTTEITLAPVRLLNRGVCSLFPGRPGPVTLLNIVPSYDGYRMAVIYGEAISTDMVFPGNPLRVQFQTDYRQILNWIVDQGLGHHWMGGYGDLRRSLSDLANMIRCQFLTIA